MSENTELPPKTYSHAIARWMILPLVQSPVTPNHITTLRLITGLIAAYFFSMGVYSWTAWGGVMFVLSMLLDRADGELARLGKKSSAWGHWYDLYSDMAVNVVIFIGIGYGLSNHPVFGPWAIAMGVISGLSVGGIFFVILQFYQSGTSPGVVFNYPHGFDLDDALFVIAVFALFDAMLILLICAVIGAPGFLLYSLWRAKKVI